MCCCPIFDAMQASANRRAKRDAEGVKLYRTVTPPDGQQRRNSMEVPTTPTESDIEKGFGSGSGSENGDDVNEAYSPIPEAVRAHLRPSGELEREGGRRSRNVQEPPPPTYEQVLEDMVRITRDKSKNS